MPPIVPPPSPAVALCAGRLSEGGSLHPFPPPSTNPLPLYEHPFGRRPALLLPKWHAPRPFMNPLCHRLLLLYNIPILYPSRTRCLFQTPPAANPFAIRPLSSPLPLVGFTFPHAHLPPSVQHSPNISPPSHATPPPAALTHHFSALSHPYLYILYSASFFWPATPVNVPRGTVTTFSPPEPDNSPQISFRHRKLANIIQLHHQLSIQIPPQIP